MNGYVVSLPTVRIVLVALRGLLRDIVWQILATERDMRVVDELPNGRSLSAALHRTPADLVIWNQDNGDEVDDDPGAWSHLFDDHPRIAVLTVRDDGRRGFLWQLRPHVTAIGELSPRVLVGAIREAVRS